MADMTPREKSLRSCTYCGRPWTHALTHPEMEPRHVYKLCDSEACMMKAWESLMYVDRFLPYDEVYPGMDKRLWRPCSVTQEDIDAHVKMCSGWTAAAL